MTLPTQAQTLSAFRWLLSVGSGYAVGRGWLTADQVTLLAAAGASLIPLVWSFFANTQAAQINATVKLEDVAHVVMKTDEAAVAIPDPRVVGPSALK